MPTPSLFEENMMSALNSIILFNKTEIINMIQEDTKFLKEMFEELSSVSTHDSKFQQLVFLLKEMCMFSLALENEDQTKLFLKFEPIWVYECFGRNVGEQSISLLVVLEYCVLKYYIHRLYHKIQGVKNE